MLSTAIVFRNFGLKLKASVDGTYAFWGQFRYITKTRLFKYIENFTSKNWKFSDKKKTDIFSYFWSKQIVGIH